MKNLGSHFRLNKRERSGVFFLLLLLIGIQLGFLGLQYFVPEKEASFQLDKTQQKTWDSLIAQAQLSKNSPNYPFNPNYLSDYKAYELGLSLEEIDRLITFRSQGKFVNSAQEFQDITLISDSLLQVLKPQFKFPSWVQKSRKPSEASENTGAPPEIRALNSATAQELQIIHGIGAVLSDRIIKFRDRLGGFLVNEQVYDVYGLDSLVAKDLLKQFQVKIPPTIKKININTASTEELASLLYIKYKVAENIVYYREQNGAFTSFDDLFNVPEFPINKIGNIALYLSY